MSSLSNEVHFQGQRHRQATLTLRQIVRFLAPVPRLTLHTKVIIPEPEGHPCSRPEAPAFLALGFSQTLILDAVRAGLVDHNSYLAGHAEKHAGLEPDHRQILLKGRQANLEGQVQELSLAEVPETFLKDAVDFHDRI